MNQKNLILIGIIAAISIITLILAVVFLTKTGNQVPASPSPQPVGIPADPNQTPSPTSVADFETYTNTKYGYSIKFPLGWATQIVITPETKTETLDIATGVDIFDSAAQKSYPEGVMTIQYLPSSPTLPGNLAKSEIKLASKSVQKYEGDEKGLHIETYVLPLSSGVLQMDVRYLLGDSIKQTFEAMLSTLQLSK